GGRKLFDRLRRACLPTREWRRRMLESDLPADIEQTNEWMIGCGDSGIAVRRLAQEALHVRLAGDQPDFANQNIFQLDGVPARDIRRCRVRISPHWIKLDEPFPSVCCGRGL